MKRNKTSNPPACNVEPFESRILFSGYTPAWNAVPASGSIPIASIPAFNSRSDASHTLYLDFIGDNTPTWAGLSPGVTPAFSLDSNTAAFSVAEQTAIIDIFNRVAEKFSPFDLNVTTVAPASLAHSVTFTVVIGGNGTWESSQQEAGGVALVGSFNDTTLPNKAFVFPANLNNSDKDTAEAIAHESGHGFGLQHQSVYDPQLGVLINEYNAGNSKIAPIMGDSYDSIRGLWWNGTSTSSHTLQNDLTVLSDHLGYAADDHPSTGATAEPLDQSTLNLTATGVIGNAKDVDYFSFTTSGGLVHLAVNRPAGGMLNARLLLTDDQSHVLANLDSGNLDESLSKPLPAGNYRVAVLSHGDSNDIGAYILSVSLPAPDPNVSYQKDPATGKKNVIVITGTSADDTILIQPAGAGKIEVFLNGVSHGTYTKVTRAIVFAGDGNDTVTIDPRLHLPSELHGDAGNDTLTGAQGRDILIGGEGADVLTGNSADDILIASDIAPAFNTAFQAVVAKWNTPTSFAARYKAFTTLFATTFPLDSTTLPDDLASNQLNGGRGADLFLGHSLDQIADTTKLDRALQLT